MEIKDLAGLSEPATKIIEALRNGIGVLYEPTRIRRLARAETEAAELVARSNLRIQVREARRQRNLESIIGKAVPLLPASTSQEEFDEDWLAEFANDAQDVSNETMQSLWARILAGQAVKQGSFSRRTLQAVRVLSQGDAKSFTHFCSYVWSMNGTYCHYAPVAVDSEVLAKEGLTFGNMLHLQSIGLVTEIGGFGGRRGFGDTGVHLSLETGPQRAEYHGRRFEGEVLSEAPKPALSVVPLTPVGEELVPIAGAKPSPAYLDYCLDRLSTSMANWRETTNAPQGSP